MASLPHTHRSVYPNAIGVAIEGGAIAFKLTIKRNRLKNAPKCDIG